MTYTEQLSRRRAITLAVASTSILVVRQAWSQTALMKVYKDPSCGCCGGWVEHIRRAGYEVTVEELTDVNPIKVRLQVPPPLSSCHTAILGTYVIEGHVPAHALARLLDERPLLGGIAVPGMPMGSPGMEGNREDIYDVIAFDGIRQAVFGRYRGHLPV